MPDSLAITMLPAKEGDCLVVQYGEQHNRKYVLIDTGRAWTYKNALKQYIKDFNIHDFELLVITHVDRDHIDGMLKLIKDPELNIQIKDIWFNTWDHLKGLKIETPDTDETIEEFGAKMGEQLSTEIVDKGWPWNRQFNGNAVELDNCPDDRIIQIGDLKLTLLSPDRQKLEQLEPHWLKECEKAGIVPGYTVSDYVVVDDEEEEFGAIDIDLLAEESFKADSSTANGSSIAFILEYKNRKFLLAGDAHADLLVDSLKHMGASDDEPVKLDLFKMPHHGSKYNISKELLNLIKCDNYLVSTNGNYFKHPDNVAMARLVKYGTKDSIIGFNYKTEFNEIWDDAGWQDNYKYKTYYPSDEEDGYLSLQFETQS